MQNDTFQLTAPHGGRQRLDPLTGEIRDISTHGPTRGPTEHHEDCRLTENISTHGPTRGPTHCGQFYLLDGYISTHGPTRGPTKPLPKIRTVIIIFQLTAPHGGRQQNSIFTYRILLLSLTTSTNFSLQSS